MPTEHGLGYLLDHPLAVASQSDPRRWPMRVLLDALPPVGAVPDHYIDPHIGLTALDQDGLGACVAFAGETVKQAQDHKDWGKYLYTTGKWTGGPDSTGAYLAYWWLKHGTPDGSFAGDGIPGYEGSYPEALWKMAKVYGLPDATGRPRKISAYYSSDMASEADDLVVQQAVIAAGPVNLGIPWPSTWSRTPPAPLFKQPFAFDIAAGHSITIAGWDVYADGLWWTCVNSWGPYWSNSQGLFRIKASWLHAAPFGPQVAWKPVDMPDAPVPGALWDIRITSKTPVYAKPSTASPVMGYAYSMGAVAQRSLVGGRWWYRIVKAGKYIGGWIVATGTFTAKLHA